METGTHPVGRTAARPLGLAFLRHAGLTRTDAQRIIASRAASLGLPVHRVLLSEGWLSAEAYVAALAADLGVASVLRPDDANPADVLIDATGSPPEVVAAAVTEVLARRRTPVLFASALDRDADAHETFVRATAAAAIADLKTASPVASAGRRMWLWQYIAAALAFGSSIGLFLAAPQQAGGLVLIGAAVLFTLIVFFRLLVLAAALVKPSAIVARPRRNHRARLKDADLPLYSVLVPLFREADIVPDLIDALSALDYPVPKLEIVLILEESDRATRRAVACASVPAHFRIIVVPDGQPRTKPKALNVALALTRGEIVAVFDAEDVPARGQLRQAAAIFMRHPGRYACLQARLAIYNPRQSRLTRQFALEYAALFHVLLPALVWWRLPLPLSGTSNHFPRAVLEASTWDPFNVTEDADLGIRLTRKAGRIGLLDSDTYEEAPVTFRQWLPQRTRWIKGWMQTYLVHTRQPFRLLRDLGLWRTFGFHALIGGFLASVLALPISLLVIAIEFASASPFAMEPGSLHHVALTIALIDFAVGIAAALLAVVIGAARARLGAIAWHILFAPVYWLLISLAAYRALIQIVWCPHLWEKTEHDPRARPRRT